RGALWTPSLVGGVLFGGAAPTDPVAIDLARVALYSILHAILFLGFGATLAVGLAHLPRMPRPRAVALIAFLGLEIGVLSGSRLVAPGLAETIGIGWITAGNALAALAVTAWLCDAVPIPTGSDPR
ncbi:MAG: hypothetical protein R3263_10635, partial [Myxococcota bacterium]|nr:hypothetical protein [Myxococcota bacterium]